MAGVLRVLRAQRDDRIFVLGDLARLGLEQLGVRVEPDPAETRPVLGPAVDEQRRLGQDEDVADPGEVVRIVALLRLVVERVVSWGDPSSQRSR